MNKLTITADREDYSVGLTGSLQIDGFSGFGEGWFNNSDVREFCSNVQNLTNNMSGAAELIGSQSKADGSEYLERFSLRCYVLSESKVNGVIGVHITLSEYPYTDCREQEILKVSGELQVRNHKLKEFSGNLNKLVQGNLDEVILNGDLNDI
jgi:hypothetical protein